VNWQASNPRQPGRAGRQAFVLHSINGSTFDEPGGMMSSGIFPYPAFELIQKSNTVFSNVFAYYPARRVNVIVDGQANVASGEYVSGEYFTGLAVAPAAGRRCIRTSY
jgi:hypothetical protein